MSRIEVTADICLRRPRPTPGCRSDDDADDNDGDLINGINFGKASLKIKCVYF
jgi:hypothetical protein